MMRAVLPDAAGVYVFIIFLPAATKKASEDERKDLIVFTPGIFIISVTFPRSATSPFQLPEQLLSRHMHHHGNSEISGHKVEPADESGHNNPDGIIKLGMHRKTLVNIADQKENG